MRFVVTFGLLVAAAALAACGDDSVAPRRDIPRAALNGNYDCVEMFAYFRGPSGTGWYEGSCRAYINVTDPSRADSLETRPFTIYDDDRVLRVDAPLATLAYDSAAGTAVFHYEEGRPPDEFAALIRGGQLVLSYQAPPFDFTGDGATDSLILNFTRVP